VTFDRASGEREPSTTINLILLSGVVSPEPKPMAVVSAEDNIVIGLLPLQNGMAV
jgi:hypothetical protein